MEARPRQTPDITPRQRQWIKEQQTDAAGIWTLRCIYKKWLEHENPPTIQIHTYEIEEESRVVDREAIRESLRHFCTNEILSIPNFSEDNEEPFYFKEEGGRQYTIEVPLNFDEKYKALVSNDGLGTEYMLLNRQADLVLQILIKQRDLIGKK